MRHLALLAILSIALTPIALGQQFEPEKKLRPTPNVVTTSPQYVLIGWNDLGMHCISPRFAEMAILPPFNNLKAIVIQRGDDPAVVTRGISISYWLDNNSTIKKKTDFWTYAPQLFGRNLVPGIGLTGNGMSGMMVANRLGLFEANGVPALPYNDARVWNPFQRATLAMSIGRGQPFKNITSVVVPVSDELNCAKCHASGKVAARTLRGPTLESNILTLHDQKVGTRLMAARPVLCAGCHSDNALAAPGRKGVTSMSLAMHGKHAALAPSVQPACYDCHPGARTQCNRSKIKDMGPVGTDPHCDNCHGDLQKMSASLRAGRQPWLEEPTCTQCHPAIYSTGTVLYRNATGHGGILCIACHNSPHAWWPSTHAEDNLQPMALQRSSFAIGTKACYVCHTDGRTGTVPPHSGD